MGNEKPFILLWRELAEQSLGWEDSDKWGEYDFERLSELIFTKTGTRLSTSTLKRIWGKVRYDSTPTIITLNALGRFVNYPDWRAFKQHSEKTSSPSSDSGRTKPIFKSNVVKYAALLIVPVLIILPLINLSWFKSKTELQEDFPVKFSARITSDNLPNSVVFDYDVSAYHSADVSIQQSWDPKRSEKVPADGKQHTSIYYVPGHFLAKLVVNGKIKKEQDIFIKTNDWMALYDLEPVPPYLKKSSILLPGALGVTDSTFTSFAKSSVWNNAWVYFYNVREFDDLDGEDFFFESNLRNTSLPEQSSCRRASVEIIGTKSGITIPLSDRGCIAGIRFFTGDHYIEGKDHDLSAFGCDFTNFQKLSCTVQKKILTIRLNNKVIHTSPVKVSIGKIVGVRIGFEGTGQAKNVILGNSRKIVYNKQF